MANCLLFYQRWYRINASFQGFSNFARYIQHRSEKNNGRRDAIVYKVNLYNRDNLSSNVIQLSLIISNKIH